MIGYWHHPVVRLSASVRLSLTLCIVALRVGVHGQKLHQRVPSRHVSICPFRHLLWDVGLSFSHKKHHKNESKKHVCPLVYIDYLLLSRVTYFRPHSSRYTL